MLLLRASPEVKRLALFVSYHVRNTVLLRAGLRRLPPMLLCAATFWLLDHLYTVKEHAITNWARENGLVIERHCSSFCEIFQLETGNTAPVQEQKIKIIILVPTPDVAEDTADNIVVPPELVAAPGQPPRERNVEEHPWWSTAGLYKPPPPPRPDTLYKFAIRSPIGGGLKVDSIVQCSVGDAIVLGEGQEIKALEGDRSYKPVSFMHAEHRAIHAPYTPNVIYWL
ncbi:unnamed protein product [Clonostachys byssicola]|uniref:Uncharacterized protein n=1 Tax=Clonostachys byssicola TaxID=160290 RepID=A0A9N9UAH9_9HYPO|nr:unnamed protein product [Clonostachys byssicola]